MLNSKDSRFQVVKGNLGNVLGIVRAKDLLALACLCGQKLDLKALLRPLFVPETMSILRLLDMLKQELTNIAVVIDE